MQPISAFSNERSTPLSTDSSSPDDDVFALWQSLGDADDFDALELDHDESPDAVTGADNGDESLAGAYEIRDFSTGNWYRAHNSLLLGGWGAAIGPYGIAVYNVLAMRATNHTQQITIGRQGIRKFCGVSPNKITEMVRELEAWGLILCEHRFGEDGQERNRYTLLGECHWRSEATFHNAKGVLVTKRLPSVAPKKGHSADDKMSDPKLRGIPPSASERRGSLHGGPGSTPCDLELVRCENHGSTQGGHIQDGKTLDQDVFKTIGERREQPSGGRTLPPMLDTRIDSASKTKTSRARMDSGKGQREDNDNTHEQPETALQIKIAQITQSKYLSAGTKGTLRNGVTAVWGNSKLPVTHPSPEDEWATHPKLFAEYVELCARRIREESGRPPARSTLVASIRKYDRYKTGWLDFKKAAQEEMRQAEQRTAPSAKRNQYYYDPNKPDWMQ